MKIKTEKNKILRICSVLLTILVFALSGKAITVQAEGIYIQEDAEDEKPDREAVKEAEEIQELLKSGSTSQGAEAMGKEAVVEQKYAAPAEYMKERLQGMADGTVNANNVLLENKINALRAETTDNTLNVENGDIVLEQSGDYNVIGQTKAHNITIESGVECKIILSDLGIDLSHLDDKASKSPIYIKKGATVELVLSGEADKTGVLLLGSPFVSGITLEDGATLRIRGKGSILVYGGGGAYAVGNGNVGGGSLWVGEEADFQAYSNRTEGAINVKVSSTADTKKILQGTLAAAPADPTIIKAENRDDRAEQYVIKLPAGYLSFAASTTTAGGDYVSYIAATEAADVEDSILLANASNRDLHSYNLTGAGNTLASLTALTSQKITYTVTFDANGGRFPDGQSKRLLKNVGYGTTISPLAEQPKRNNHDLLGWHRTKDSFEENDQWRFEGESDSNVVVRDGMLLYASWKPIDCTVRYYSIDNVEPVKEVTGKKFGDTVSDDPLKTNENPPSLVRKGFTLVGWLAEDGSDWIFGDDGTKITKETTVLKANWLADCQVTFNANAGTDTVTGMPSDNPMTVPATRPIAITAKPQRLEYTFIGWYRDAKCTKPWDMNSDKVTGNITLYAGWGANNTTVSYHVSADGTESVSPLINTVAFGEKIPEPAAKRDARTTLPTEYAVEGWYTDAKLTNKWDFSEGLKDSNGSFDLYVKWRQVTCWATFRPNSADAVPQEEQSLWVDNGGTLRDTYGDDLDNMLAGMFTRTGYEVESWVTDRGKVWDMSEDSLTEDIILKALWQPEVYKINFDTSQEGCPALSSSESSKEVAYGKTLSQPNYPADGQNWLGHTFQGWYTEEDGKGEKWSFAGAGAADTVKGDMTLYAYWTQDEYTINFQTYAEDENPIGPYTGVHYGDLLAKPDDPVRERYQFLGWYKDEERTELWDFAADQVTGDMTLYAGWQGEPVDVVLNVKYEPENEDSGKIVQVDLEEVRFGDFLTREQVEDQETEATKKRPGYTLNGWYTDELYQDEGLWDFALNRVEPPKNEPLNLYAYWTWDEYTAQFITYDGDSSVPPQTGLRYGNLLAKPSPDPVREHYTFGAWHTVQNPEDDTTVWNFTKSKVTGDMSLYAAWTPDIYTLSFETNGGSVLEPVKVTYGTYVSSESLKTTKEGYVLAGWYRDPELTQPFAPASEYVDRAMTIYAKWELKKYTVRYHYRDSLDSAEEEVETYKEAYKVGDYLAKPNKTVPHKTLSPWYQDDTYQDKWVFKRDQVRGDTDLYAYWSDTQYTVHFETYDGTEMKDLEMIWGEQPEQPEDPARTGYTFTGWYKDAKWEEPWDFSEDFVNGNTTIYSGWEANMYTVSFDTAGGSEAAESQTLAYGSLITEPAAPTRDGYTFEGWAGPDGNPWNFSKDTLKEDTVLTAQWSENISGDGNNENTSGGTSGTGTPGSGTQSSGTPGSGATGSGTDTSAQALKSAAGDLKEILTGDKAPLTYSIAGIILAAAGILGALYKKIR